MITLIHLAVWLLAVIITVSDVPAAVLTASWVDNSSGRAAFQVERRSEDETMFSIVAHVPPQSVSYADSTVTEGLTYCYRVKAVTDTGESPYSDEACGSVALNTAPPPAQTFRVSVTKAGTGDGIVSASANGLVCGSQCSATFAVGTVVTLKAAPSHGSRFIGWSGGCSGFGACTLTGNTSVAVIAQFRHGSPNRHGPPDRYGPPDGRGPSGVSRPSEANAERPPR